MIVILRRSRREKNWAPRDRFGLPPIGQHLANQAIDGSASTGIDRRDHEREIAVRCALFLLSVLLLAETVKVEVAKWAQVIGEIGRQLD